MKTYTSSEARKNFFTLLDDVVNKNEGIVVNKRGLDAVVILPMKQYKAPEKKKFEDSPLFGIWKNRKDMQDSVKWVNDLRIKTDNRQV